MHVLRVWIHTFLLMLGIHHVLMCRDRNASTLVPAAIVAAVIAMSHHPFAGTRTARRLVAVFLTALSAFSLALTVSGPLRRSFDAAMRGGDTPPLSYLVMAVCFGGLAALAWLWVLDRLETEPEFRFVRPRPPRRRARRPRRGFVVDR